VQIKISAGAAAAMRVIWYRYMQAINFPSYDPDAKYDFAKDFLHFVPRNLNLVPAIEGRA